MDPFTIALVAATGMKALGQLQQADAESQAHRYNAGVAAQQAVVEGQQASAREDAQRRQARQVLGQQRAAFAQSGGGMGGSAGDIMGQSAIDAELDALTIRYEGQMRARGFDAQAEQERFAARSAKKAGYWAAAGTVLGGAADYYGARAGAPGGTPKPKAKMNEYGFRDRNWDF